VYGDYWGCELGYLMVNFEFGVEGMVLVDGVYVGWMLCLEVFEGVVEVDWLLFVVVLIGINLMFDGIVCCVEVYVFDCIDFDFYGECVSFELVEWLCLILCFDFVDLFVD